MSTETDIAEIKQTLNYLTERISEGIAHSKEMCVSKHKEIDQHIAESPRFRDMVIDVVGKVSILSGVVTVILIGILGIAYVVIQKVLQ